MCRMFFLCTPSGGKSGSLPFVRQVSLYLIRLMILLVKACAQSCIRWENLNVMVPCCVTRNTQFWIGIKGSATAQTIGHTCIAGPSCVIQQLPASKKTSVQKELGFFQWKNVYIGNRLQHCSIHTCSSNIKGGQRNGQNIQKNSFFSCVKQPDTQWKSSNILIYRFILFYSTN